MEMLYVFTIVAANKQTKTADLGFGKWKNELPILTSNREKRNAGEIVN